MCQLSITTHKTFSSYLLEHKLFKDLPALTVIIRPLTQRPRRLESARAARPKRRGPFAPLVVGSDPWRQPAPVALHSPSLEPLLGVTVRLDGIPREPNFSTHAAPISRFSVRYGPLRRTGKDGLLDLEVKVGDGFGIALCFGILTTPRIGLADKTRVDFVVCATAMDGEGRGRLGLRKQKAIEGLA